MTIEEMAAVVADRVPNPDEVQAFVRGQGWEIRQKETGPVLRVHDLTDALAVAMARLLRREPWRSQVTTLAKDPATAVKIPQLPPAARECRACRAAVFAAFDAAAAVALCHTGGCPHRPPAGGRTC